MNTGQGIFGPGGHGGGIFQTTVSGLGSWDTKQGIFGPGGHGGGIFQTTVSGMGEVSASEGTADQMRSLPAGTYSPVTKMIQADANGVLPSMGLAKISEDGKLGPKTCAAIAAIIKNGKISGWVMPTACSNASSSTTSNTTTAPSVDPGVSSGFSFSLDTPEKKIAVVAAATLVALGAYYLWSKK